MKLVAGLLTAAALILVGCGDDDGGGGGGDDGGGGGNGGAQAELADLLTQDVAFGVDPDCLRDKTDELSDEQAEFLVDNIDADSTEGFDAELQAWVAGLVECIDDQLIEAEE